MGRTLEEAREYQRNYYYKNREKVKAYQKEYQEKYRQDPEAMARKSAYMKEYNKKYMAVWGQKPENKEKRKKYIKKYHLKNKSKIREYQKEYYKQPKGKKMMRMANWRQIGIIDKDLDLVYDVYINETNCWICDKKFKNARERHLDHCHDTGEIRYICCRNCNITLLSNSQT
tara:strand:+ start:2871 stop:3386 length:516 start_codon:yes stop_codon:yes gene_type:complete